MVTSALEVQSLRKKFGSHTAVDGVSFVVAPGQHVALLGPNGAGKTTAVRCVCGLTKPDSGHVLLEGEPPVTSHIRAKLGYIPQDVALYEELSAAQNLRAFGRFQNLRGTQLKERIDWALHWAGLEAESKKSVSTFSGGMKRRLNIACGILHAPSVVLLDEPTVGVDPQSRERIFSMLSSLKQQGTAILLTTHHLDEAETQCDKILVMDHGNIVAQGTFPQLVRSTVGTSSQLEICVAEQPHTEVPRWHVDRKRRKLSTRIEDVAKQMPSRIREIEQAGFTITDVAVARPSLHDVFLHLTGKELRDGTP